MPGNPDILRLARELASRVKVSRLAFRQAYDVSIAGFAGPGSATAALPANFLLAITSAGGLIPPGEPSLDPALDAEAYCLALVVLQTPAAFTNVVEALVAEEVFYPAGSDAAGRRAIRLEISGLLAPLGVAPPATEVAGAPLVQGRPEAITDPLANWVLPEKLGPGVLLALRRVCRITAPGPGGNRITGTGFLIGPSAVLTNWHVIEALVPAPGQPAVLAKDELIITFDGLNSLPGEGTPVPPLRTGWLLAHSSLGPRDPDAPDNRLGWWQKETVREAYLARLANHLDYAVIALDSAPGDLRGWYTLSDSDMSRPRGTCSVFHHPGGQAMVVSSGSIVHSSRDHPNRVFHGANTHGGSSGGLMLNAAGDPVALHNASYAPAGPLPDGRATPRFPDEVINTAVPLNTIAASIGAAELGKIARQRRMAVPLGCLADGQPVFGRETLFDALQDMVGGSARILWIKPPAPDARRCGKSFSTRVLRELRRENDIFLEISADQVKADGFAMAAFLLESVSGGLSAQLPGSADADTTEAAYFPDRLVPALFNLIATAAAGRMLWLIIDDLDVIHLPDSGGRRLLDVLYRRITECPPLRIVLIGLNSALSSIPSEVLRIDVIQPGDTTEAVRLFCNWLAHNGERDRPIAPEVKQMLGAMIQSYTGEDGVLPKLSDFSRAHLLRPLAVLFGRAKP